jgi:hypothetical protein
MSLELNQVLNFYQDQYSVVDSIWGYFTTVILAILGFTIGSKIDRIHKLEIRLMQVGFLVFAVGNYIALFTAQKNLLMFANYINTKIQGVIPLVELNPTPLCSLSFFYFMIVVSVLIGLEIIFYLRNKAKID